MKSQVITEVVKAVERTTKNVEDFNVEYVIKDGVYFLLDDGLEMEDQSFESFESMMFIVNRSIEDFGYDVI